MSQTYSWWDLNDYLQWVFGIVNLKYIVLKKWRLQVDTYSHLVSNSWQLF